MLEAFAACLPVMVSDVGGLKDLVVDNDNGYCFDPFSRQSISDCMQRVFENKHSLINFAKKSYDKFDMFTIYQSYLEYFEEYNFLLNERDV